MDVRVTKEMNIMTTHVMNYSVNFVPTRHTNSLRLLDVLVAGFGLAIACCCYFASEITWLLVQL
jgi:hypothetical protein